MVLLGHLSVNGLHWGSKETLSTLFFYFHETFGKRGQNLEVSNIF